VTGVGAGLASQRTAEQHNSLTKKLLDRPLAAGKIMPTTVGVRWAGAGVQLQSTTDRRRPIGCYLPSAARRPIADGDCEMRWLLEKWRSALALSCARIGLRALAVAEFVRIRAEPEAISNSLRRPIQLVRPTLVLVPIAREQTCSPSLAQPRIAIAAPGNPARVQTCSSPFAPPTTLFYAAFRTLTWKGGSHD
jgi:hypothetical protein